MLPCDRIAIGREPVGRDRDAGIQLEVAEREHGDLIIAVPGVRGHRGADAREAAGDRERIRVEDDVRQWIERADRREVVGIEADLRRPALIAGLHDVRERAEVGDVDRRAFVGGLIGHHRERRLDAQAERDHPEAAVLVDDRDRDGLLRRPMPVVYDQLHVPSPLLITVPIDATSVTLSAGTSLYVPLLVTVWLTSATTDALSTVSVGSTFFTSRLNVTTVTPPSSSVAVIVTVCTRSSAVPYDQFHTPALCVTVPIEETTVTVSAGTSANVPLFVAVVPSSATTDALLTVSDGLTFLTLTVWVPAETVPLPLVRVAVMT